LSSAGPIRAWGGVKFGNRILDHRCVTVSTTLVKAFRPIARIGGETGWYYGNFWWRLRGVFDYLVGGVGLRRGRRDSEKIRVGESIDFWRVEAFEPNKRLRLFAEMKLPGRAWLEFQVQSQGSEVEICQTANFDPLGVWGLLYWYLLYPLHALIFRGMLKGIANQATLDS